MIVSKSNMEINQQSNQINNVEKLSPKKEQSPGGVGGHEECVLLTSCANTSDGTLTSVSGGEDLYVDIVEADENNTSTSTDEEEEDPNATEYSSSFSDTSSEDDADMLCNDAEVESHYWDETDLGPAYDSFSSVFHFRKKRLTNHWKSFIRPLMWRSKWLELRIRELETQALEYPKKLESLDQEKLGAAANTDPSVLDNGMKSLPFSNPSYKKRAAKRRRKRKKVESTDDIASYLSHHNLFSYIETKRLSSDGMSVAADDFGAAKDPRIDSKEQVDLVDDDSLFDHREGDSVLEEVLWKIELVHSQVLRMKSQVDVVMSKNAARFSSSENLSLLAASSAPSPTVSAGGGDVISIGAIYNSSHHMPDYVLGDLVFSSEVSSYGDAFHIPDIIESTVGLFADADVTLHHPQIGDSCEDILDNILIRNGVAVEMNGDVMETSSHEEGEKGEEGEGTNVPPLLEIQETEQGHQEDKSLVLQDSVLRSCLASEMLVVPRNKRTRGGERKASSWCKKHLSDPESQ